MPHDVSSLLSCLYQFKSENAALQKQFDELKHRRDSLRVTNANLRRKLSEISSINDSSHLPTKSSKMTSSEMEYLPTSYDAIHPYPMIKNERLPPTNGISLELLSQILTTNGPQLFAPTWNISVRNDDLQKKNSIKSFYRILVMPISLGQIPYPFLTNHFYVHIHRLNNNFNLR
jgi:hypothetical protein